MNVQKQALVIGIKPADQQNKNAFQKLGEETKVIPIASWAAGTGKIIPLFKKTVAGEGSEGPNQRA